MTTENVKLFFRGSNLLEINIADYLEASSTKAKLTFKYPLVDLDGIGYHFTIIDANMIANQPNRTLFSDYIKYFTDYDTPIMGVLTGLPLLFVSSLGGNWFFFNAIQKLYLQQFVNVQYSGDLEDFLHVMRFSFFSWV